MENDKKVEIIGQYGATLSIIEVGFGSLLHAFQVPMAGVALSLNQNYILCRAALKARGLPDSRWTTYSISNISAVLKSLSPAGKKLGPMLSLSMQGLLFNIGTAIFGVNPFGLITGSALSSVWTFLQPLITYYLFFGEKLVSAIEYMYEKSLPYHNLKAEIILCIFIGLVVAKMVAAIVLALIAWRRQDKSLYAKNYEEEILRFAKDKMQKGQVQNQHPIVGAIGDLCRPLFLISLATTGIFLYFSQSDHSMMIWYLLRPVAIGFIFFYISRTLTLDRWLVKLEQGRFRSFSLSIQNALCKIRKF